MPRKKAWKKPAIFNGGGGCRVGFPQAVQNHLLHQALTVERGIPIPVLAGQSVGGLNILSLEEALFIWRRSFHQPLGHIYNFHPDLEAIFFEELLPKIIELKPHWPLRRHHKNRKEFLRDFNAQIHNLWGVIRFGKRTLFSIIHLISRLEDLGGSGKPTLKDFVSSAQELQYVLSALKLVMGHRKIRGLFDLSPLFDTIAEVIDFEKLLDPQGPARYILAEHNEEIHFFAINPSPAFLERHGTRVHVIETKEQVLEALRATTALRPVIESKTMEGKRFRDSGTAHPFPVEDLFDEGCDIVFAFVDNYLDPAPDDENNILDVNTWMNAIDRPTRELFKRSYKQAQDRALREGRELHLITTTKPIHPDLQTFWISPEAQEYALRVETEEMQKFLRKLLA